MYIYFSHQNNVPCFHMQDCFLFLFRRSRTWRMSFSMTQYVCAQGEGIRVLFVFDLVRIPH